MLEAECTKNGDQIDDDDKQYFFGLYQSTPDKFKFLPGEIILIKEIAKEVKKIVERDGLEAFVVPKNFNVSRKDSCRLFGCTFFGKPSNKRKRNRMKLNLECHDVIEDKIDEQPASKSLIVEFITKAKRQFELVDPKLKGQDYLSENMVVIKNNGRRIIASVECVFCSMEKKSIRTMTVQYDIAKNNVAYWNFSNLKTHFKQHVFEMDPIHENDSSNHCNKSVEVDQTLNNQHSEGIHNIQENDSSNHCEEVDHGTIDGNSEGEHTEDNSVDINDEKMITLSDESMLDTSGTSAEDIEQYEITEIVGADSVEYAIYQQISQQNIALTEAIHTNNEKKHLMVFKLHTDPTKLTVIKIASDGNCMYASIAHQLFGHEVGSADHENAAASLRKATVEHINENFDEFSYELKGRVLEEREAKGTKNRKNVTENDCKKFLKQLTKKSTFGGAESFKAISRMHSVNILVFVESEVHYFPIGFNSNYDKTVFIAYRLIPGSQNVRNHYDSVAEVNLQIIYDCVSVLNAAASDKSTDSNTVNTTL